MFNNQCTLMINLYSKNVLTEIIAYRKTDTDFFYFININLHENKYEG